MPSLNVRKASDVPAPIHTTKAIREQQQLFESFIGQATGNVGELTLEPSDSVRSVKVKLRRAATRTGVNLEIWDVDGKVYFQAEARQPRKYRPRKTA